MQHNYTFFFLYQWSTWSIITHKDRMWNSILIVNYLQGNSYGTPIIFCLLEETLFSPCLTTKSLRFGLVKFTKSLCNMTQLNLRPRESQAWCYCAFKYTWDQNKNHYSEAFREGQVTAGRSLLLGSPKPHVPNPSHKDPEGVKFSVAWQAAGFLLEKLIIS